MPLLQGATQEGREFVFTQIDGKAGGDNVPMRCVQNAQYGYIYNPFSDGKHVYRNNNEGLTMAAMNRAAETDASIKARVDLFRYRVAEEFYDLKNDPDCLHNLIADPAHAEAVKALQDKLAAQMKKTEDPMLVAFQNRNDRAKVDEILIATYGSQKNERPGVKKKEPAVRKTSSRNRNATK